MDIEIIEAVVRGALEWGTSSSWRRLRWGCTAFLVLVCLSLLSLPLWVPLL